MDYKTNRNNLFIVSVSIGIGRVDRRMNFDIENVLVKDHPKGKAIRGTGKYWNFLPPGELNELLNLFKKVSNKWWRVGRAAPTAPSTPSKFPALCMCCIVFRRNPRPALPRLSQIWTWFVTG